MQTNSKVETNQNNFNPLLATPLKHFTVRRVSFGLQHCRKFFRIFGMDTDQQYSRAWTWWWTEYRNQGILVHVLSYFFWLKDGSRVRSPLFDSKTFPSDHDPMNYDDHLLYSILGNLVSKVLSLPHLRKYPGCGWSQIEGGLLRNTFSMQTLLIKISAFFQMLDWLLNHAPRFLQYFRNDFLTHVVNLGKRK